MQCHHDPCFSAQHIRELLETWRSTQVLRISRSLCMTDAALADQGLHFVIKADLNIE